VSSVSEQQYCDIKIGKHWKEILEKDMAEASKEGWP